MFLSKKITSELYQIEISLISTLAKYCLNSNKGNSNNQIIQTLLTHRAKRDAVNLERSERQVTAQ